MPYELFWHGPLNAYFAYMQKAQIEAEQQAQLLDVEAWRKGIYVKDALMSVYHAFNGMLDGKKAKKYPYPKQPYSQSELEKKRREKLPPKRNYKKDVEAHNREMNALVKKAMEQQIQQSREANS